MLRVSISAPVKPSEDPKKVAAAVSAIFPEAHLEIAPDNIQGLADGAPTFGRLMREQGIRCAGRAALLRSRKGSHLRFSLNKQAAFMGKVSFGLRCPLGNIDVEVDGSASEIDAFLDEMVPQVPIEESGRKNGE